MKLKREHRITATALHPMLGQLLFEATRPRHARVLVAAMRMDGTPLVDGGNPPRVELHILQGETDDTEPWTPEHVLWGGLDRGTGQELAMYQIDFFAECLAGRLKPSMREKPGVQYWCWTAHRDWGSRLAFKNVTIHTDQSVVADFETAAELHRVSRPLFTFRSTLEESHAASNVIAQAVANSTEHVSDQHSADETGRNSTKSETGIRKWSWPKLWRS